MQGTETFNVLFLCTGNSARSQIAACILNRLGKGRFDAYSAGSHPTGSVNRYALELLKRLDYETDQLRSMDWAEFATADAPGMDCIITVCDDAAGEVCPLWPGQPVTVHWGIPDPAAFEGSEAEIRAAFVHVYEDLHSRLEKFVARQLSFD